MKYIRTKDGITTKEKFWFNNGGIGELIGTKEADTIEELCDVFVMVSKDHEFPQTVCKMNYEYCKTRCIWKSFYGAIWTDKGLIYVAKMNEKGELELL